MKIFRMAMAAMAALPLCSAAQEADSTASGRITTAAYMVGAGRTKVLDTYLSQEHFAGPGVTFLASVERQRPGSRWPCSTRPTSLRHATEADSRASWRALTTSTGGDTTAGNWQPTGSH